jgi:AAA domain
MRIAISGSHRVGKTTLAEALAETLPEYDLIPEPYYQLEEDGYEFEATPSLEDFERQLERSIQSISDSGGNVIFDRCPLDILGYLLTHHDAEAFEIQDWLPRVRAAVAKLDLIVFVPIEDPDRVAVPRAEAPLRASVDEVLREIVEDDSYELEMDVITVEGSAAARLRQAVEGIRSSGR